MAAFSSHPALSSLQSSFFKHSSNMYPADYGAHFRSLPVGMPNGTVNRVDVSGYRSTYPSARRKACYNFLVKAKPFCDKPASPYKLAGDWLRVHQTRVVACFAGQGLPEEISLVCSLAVASGLMTADELPHWANLNFGQDCVGFVSGYLVALGTFEAMLLDIPTYRQISGTATRIDDIKYDNAILMADVKGDGVKIRPNPGNKSHIMIVECWEQYGSSMYVAQSSSSKNGVDYDRVYQIVQEPKTQDPLKAYWKLRRNGASSFVAVITKTVPAWTGAD